MKKLFTALCLLALACRADKNDYVTGGEKEAENIRNISFNKLLLEAGETRRARVANLQYYETESKRLALVTYQLNDNPGYFNMAVEETKDPITLMESGRTYVCQGIGCNCRIDVSVGSDGQVQMNCSCSTCDLIVAESMQTTGFLNSLSNPSP